MRRLLAWTPLVGLALLGLLFAAFALRHDPHVDPAALVGKRLPAVVLPGLDGSGPRPLTGELQGPTLVNLFASWCGPCAQEAPALAALKAQGVRIVGVAYKDEPAATRGFIARYGDPFAAVRVDRDGRAGIELGASGVPETFAVDRRGVVVAKHSGPLSPADAESMLETVR